ncbi:MAG: competence/damage-inducible protein A [Oligoflexia bacterium]|nr:competence/damage-inducible protein A [Oligoflexia bacterium]
MKTAQILIIGDEILSGRTQDTNSLFLARALYARGIRVLATQVLPDQINVVSQWIRRHYALADYLFICGGIGGTPDDITRAAVARALDVPLTRNVAAEKLLRSYYKDKINDDRLQMADLPEGCDLIQNNITLAPGLRIKNIFVFAGIPRIMHSMFESIEGLLLGSTPMHERELRLQVGEGEIAAHMRTLLKEFPDLELGSYPRVDPSQDYRTQLIFKSLNAETVERAQMRFEVLIGARKA